jgi:ubiquinone biosynthesis protein UbiJ
VASKAAERRSYAMSKSTEALKQAHDKLQDAVAEIVSGEDWQRML